MSFDKQYMSILIQEENYDELIGYCTKCADEGNAEAAAALAICFYGAPDRTEEFFSYANMAHEMGESDGTVALALAYMSGYGIREDKKRAFELFTTAADAGNAWAMYMRGECAEQGAGIAKDIDIAVESYVAAAQNGYKDAYRTITSRYIGGKDIRWCIAAAEVGFPAAEFDLATRYSDGVGVERDDEKATALFNKCIERGNADACYLLAQNYMSRHLTVSAYAMYAKAAELGKSGLQEQLKRMLDNINRAEATRKKANDGDSRAAYEYGLRAERGDGTDKNLECAKKYYSISAIVGNKYAQYKLAKLYETDKHEFHDIQKAIEWYRQASEGDDPHALSLYRLYMIYSQGDEVQKNTSYANACLVRAAEAGYKAAYYPAAVLCDSGKEGVRKDVFKSAQLYERAAQFGNENAKKRISTILKAASQGDAEAQAFAWAYYSTKKTEDEHKLATSMLEQSARSGYEPAVEQMMHNAEQSALLTQDEKHRLIELNIEFSEHDVHELRYNAGLVYKSASERCGDDGLKTLTSIMFKNAAEAGVANAEYEYGLCCEYGCGLPADSKAAFNMYLNAYAKGSIKALTKIGDCYMHGIGTATDTTLALTYLDQASQAGEATADYILADYAEEHEKDLDKAFDHLLKAAQLNHAQAQLKLGKYFEQGFGTDIDIQAALGWYELAAENGLQKALYPVAECYENGNGVAQDKQRALSIYKQIADKSCPQAQLKVAKMHECGIDTDVDYKKAFDMYLQAADAGNAEAMYNVGRFYENGIATERSCERAIPYYIQAADMNNTEAAYRMAVYYSSGVHVPYNKEKAVQYCELAAKAGYAPALYRLGMWNQGGIAGYRRNIKQALQFYQDAADMDYAPAIYALAQCCSDGNGMAKNASRAVKLYKKAADMDYAPAVFRLGVFYESGYCVEQDISLATLFFKRAHMLGYEAAAAKLGRLR